MKQNDERERSRVKTALVRSKSMGNLQSSPVSIKDLKARFESKAANQSAKSSFRATNHPQSYEEADTMEVMNGEAESPTDEIKPKIPVHGPGKVAEDDCVFHKVNSSHCYKHPNVIRVVNRSK